ncbi:hypothetical protein MTO96_048587 [Rhipicephalus appendiculatus]
MVASASGKKGSKPADTASNVPVRHPAPPLGVHRERARPCHILRTRGGWPAFLQLRAFDWAAAPTCCLYITQRGLGGLPWLHLRRGRKVPNPQTPRPTSRCGIRRRRSEYTGSVLGPVISCVPEGVGRPSCSCVLLIGRRHQPAAGTSHSEVWEGDQGCIYVGERFQLRRHRVQRPVRHPAPPLGVREDLGQPCHILRTRGGWPAFLQLRGPDWAAAPTCCLYITQRGLGGRPGLHLRRGRKVPSPQTSRPTSRCGIRPRRSEYAGSLVGLVILGTRGGWPALLQLRGLDWAAAPTCCLYMTQRGLRGRPGLHLRRGKVSSPPTSRPTSRCGIRHRRSEYAGELARPLSYPGRTRSGWPAFLQWRGLDWPAAPTCCLYITHRGLGGRPGLHMRGEGFMPVGPTGLRKPETAQPCLPDPFQGHQRRLPACVSVVSGKAFLVNRTY